MDIGMCHQSAGLPDDSLNGPFGDAVLMMGANPGEAIPLTQLREMRGEGGGGKGTIVEMVRGDRDSMVAKTRLKEIFGTQGVGGR
jgi:hypothetical protein